MRTIIEVPEEQLKALLHICDSQNISRAEAIRRAISLYLEEAISSTEDPAFGMWREKNIDSIDYQNKLRDEWE